MLKFVYKIFPLIVFASYPILLVYTFLWQKDLFLKSLTVPAGVFLGITLLRIIIKEERPYVRYGVAPVSVSRVCAGVHYVRDVIVGAAIAILCGIVFLFLVF